MTAVERRDPRTGLGPIDAQTGPLPIDPRPDPGAAGEVEYRLITSPGQLSPYLKQLLGARVIAVDTETTALDPHRGALRLVQLAVPGAPVFVLDCFSFLPAGRGVLRQILTTGAVKVFHNAKFDLQFFLKLGISVPLPLFDTMLAAQLLRSSGGPERSSLAAVAEHYLGAAVSKEEQASNWSGPLRAEQLRYAARDAQVLLALRQALVPLLQEHRLVEVAALEFACVRAVAQMEFHGIHLDLARWEALRRRTEAAREEVLQELYRYTGRPVAQLGLWGDEQPLEQNLDSNQQVLELLHQHGIHVQNTSRHALAPYASHPLVKALTSYRQHTKALTSFLNSLTAQVHPRTGRLHPRYAQIGAASGRMSCGNPNIQQIPRDAAFRACFVAPAGRRLIIADYSQIELRVAAALARDARMIAAYQAGEDLHRLTASLVTGKPMAAVTSSDRQAAKAVNFGLIYAMGPRGLQAYARDTYGMEMSLEEATRFRERFFEAYTGIAAWHAKMRAHPPGETRTVAGRRHVHGPSEGLSVLSNMPVQGSAADIAKRALGQLVDALAGTGAFIVAAVHDEIVLEADAANADDVAGLLKETMEAAGAHYLRDVPVVAEVHVAESWAGKG